MLVEFKVANFRSFRDGQSLNLTATRDDRLVDNVMIADKHRLVKAAAVYGPNASGKSNLIKAIRLMDYFIESSATQTTLGDPIPGISPFRLSPEYQSRPTSFEATVLVSPLKYKYGFSATANSIVEEWLEVTQPGGRPSTWLHRESNPVGTRTKYTCKGPLKRHQELLSQRTRDNGLALSRAADLNIEEVSELFLWFKKHLWTMDLSSDPFGLAQQTARRMSRDPALKRRALRLLQDADIGITDLAIAKRDAFELTDGATEQVASFVREVRKLVRGEDGMDRRAL